MSKELEKRQLPTLQELSQDIELSKNQDALNYLLNQQPVQAWIKKHPYVNVKVNGQNQPLEYLSVEKVKQLLTQIFQVWESEIVDYKALFNSVAVQVRLRVKNPLTGEWITHDGVGAVDVQTKAGASAADLSQINASAVMKALPAAASYALKNAAEKLGAIFGGHLQKYDLTPFMPSYNSELKETLSKNLKEKYNGAKAEGQ
jgi:hypothetical protein